MRNPPPGGDLVILVPMLGRPHRVVPLLQSIRDTCTARVLFLVTPGDRHVLDAVRAVGGEMLAVPWQPVGDFQRKINSGYRHTTEPLIFTGADDLEFRPGWYEAAVACLTPGIGVVGTNDLSNPRVIVGEHATHSLITREYADRGTIDVPRRILHEGYVHEFCDDELIETAKSRKAFAFAEASHVKHLHPMFNPGVPTDPMYAQQSRRMRVSRPLYQARRALWAEAVST